MPVAFEGVQRFAAGVAAGSRRSSTACSHLCDGDAMSCWAGDYPAVFAAADRWHHPTVRGPISRGGGRTAIHDRPFAR